MKTISLVVLALWCSTFKTLPTDNYTISPTKSKVKWTGHADAGVYAPTGTIKIKTGTVVFNSGKLSSATIVIDMTTLEQENKDLEKHLKNTDFFDVEKFPEAAFKLNAMNGNTATGSLTIKGITKSISFPVTIQKQDGQINIIANLKIDRTLFGIKYNSASFFQDLGSYAIKNEFDLEVMLVAEAS